MFHTYQSLQLSLHSIIWQPCDSASIPTAKENGAHFDRRAIKVVNDQNGDDCGDYEHKNDKFFIHDVSSKLAEGFIR